MAENRKRSDPGLDLDSTREDEPPHFDVIIVGAGFSGLYALHRVRRDGLTARVFEAGDGVGGTWYWNRYPGCRCDVESVAYSYSFSEDLEQEWTWTERYPSQPEILRYLNHVADRFQLRPDIQLRTRVTAASYDETADRWLVETDTSARLTASFLVMAAGNLSTPQKPHLNGLETFAGELYHTGEWPHEGVDFTGKRVAVFGTGSSGIQAIPEIATQADHLVVFQRTPNFSVPARNRLLDATYVRDVKTNYRDLRQKALKTASGQPNDPPTQSALEVSQEERRERWEAGWERGGPPAVMAAYTDVLLKQEANDALAEFVRGKIRETVHDAATAERLSPRDHPIGAKRICVDTDYYATYNRPNVTLVDLRATPLEEVTVDGVRTSASTYDLDAIVFATGFDAMTGALARIDIRGRAGALLRDKWSGGPRTYLGIQSAGFPNMFIITGPGSPSVLTNMVVAIEQHVDFVAELLEYMRGHGLTCVEPSPDAEDRWVQHVNEVADRTLYPRANSWYMGANIPGKTRVFMPYVGGLAAYRRICDEVASKGYEGLAFLPPQDGNADEPAALEAIR
jgi:cyclohexanone monooxygenase